MLITHTHSYHCKYSIGYLIINLICQYFYSTANSANSSLFEFSSEFSIFVIIHYFNVLSMFLNVSIACNFYVEIVVIDKNDSVRLWHELLLRFYIDNTNTCKRMSKKSTC